MQFTMHRRVEDIPFRPDYRSVYRTQDALPHNVLPFVVALAILIAATPAHGCWTAGARSYDSIEDATGGAGMQEDVERNQFRAALGA